jgi:uncharacterized protein (DUF305 family)
MRRALLALTVVTLLLAACGEEEVSNTSAQAPSDAHNEADVAFLTGMIPHHQQAVVMSDMAATQASNLEVKGLAQRIKGGQQPEIDQMRAGCPAGGWRNPSGTVGTANTAMPIQAC